MLQRNPCLPCFNLYVTVLLYSNFISKANYQLNNLDDGNILADFFHTVGIQNNKKIDFTIFYFQPSVEMYRCCLKFCLQGIKKKVCP